MKFNTIGAAVLAASLAVCLGPASAEKMFKPIGKIGECQMWQIFDRPGVRTYRVECPTPKWPYRTKDLTGVKINSKALDPRVKCRVTYVVGVGQAHDFNNLNQKWATVSTIMCWGPKLPGHL